MLLSAVGAFAAMTAAAPASALVYVLEAQGTVVGGAPGDTLSLKATFDTAGAILSPAFASNPAIAIYMFQPSQVDISTGGHTSSFVTSTPGNATAQLWNGNPVGGAGTDAQSFTFSRLTGNGTSAESVTLSAFDFSGLAANSVSLSELGLSPGLFDPAYLTYSFLNVASDPRSAVTLHTQNVKWTLTPQSAVPETGTWAMMIAGFAVVGMTLRRSRGRAWKVASV
jgi:hypothetical protein